MAFCNEDLPNEVRQREKFNARLFDSFVSNIGLHCAYLHRKSGQFAASAVHGMPVIYIIIVPKVEGKVDDWDMCHLCDEDWNKIKCLGNRSGASQYYSEMAAKALREFITEAKLAKLDNRSL